MNRGLLIQVTQLRLREVRTLLKSGHYEGAYYLCGYAVECGLKACIAKKTRRHDFPDKKTVQESYTHDLSKLVKVAGLEPALKEDTRRDAPFAANWAVVKDWTEEGRYQFRQKREAQDLYSAVTSRRHGVMRWIRRHW